MSKLIIYLALTMVSVLVLACGNSSSENSTGVLQESYVEISSALLYTKESRSDVKNSPKIRKDLPPKIWVEMEERRLNYAIHLGKEPFCVVRGEGIPFESGAKVEIIQLPTNNCMKSMLMVEGQAASKLPLGMVKVRITDSGQEGWTWDNSVIRDE
ncbi:MAG: hypothetical protein FI687_00640 [SAR202 cluster bacterium]|nr:hypothetical protein [SAR202 cluster bacterium]